MIEIKKLTPPQELINYARTSNATYADMPRNVKAAVLSSLEREQGHLCAYCMRKIPETRQLPQGVSACTIEHWQAQNPIQTVGQDRSLDYGNMFAVCSGNRGCKNKKNLTCDAKRGNDKLTVNPCKPTTLFQISYNSKGEIYSKNSEVDEDLNVRLNLNCSAISLPATRKQVLEALINNIRKNYGSGDINTYCSRILNKLLEQEEQKNAYLGIQIDWLKRHIK